MEILQDRGDHHVSTDRIIVLKTPLRSPSTPEQIKMSIDFFENFFPGFTIPTVVTTDPEKGYIIKQKFIKGNTLGMYLESRSRVREIDIQIKEFSRLAMKALNETGIFFDPIGYPYGLCKGKMENSSNLIISEDPKVLLIVDNILGHRILNQNLYMRKVINYTFPGRRRRKDAFIHHMSYLQNIGL